VSLDSTFVFHSGVSEWGNCPRAKSLLWERDRHCMQVHLFWVRRGRGDLRQAMRAGWPPRHSIFKMEAIQGSSVGRTQPMEIGSEQYSEQAKEQAVESCKSKGARIIFRIIFSAKICMRSPLSLSISSFQKLTNKSYFNCFMIALCNTRCKSTSI
jgi:hypothetical protein